MFGTRKFNLALLIRICDSNLEFELDIQKSHSAKCFIFVVTNETKFYFSEKNVCFI